MRKAIYFVFAALFLLASPEAFAQVSSPSSFAVSATPSGKPKTAFSKSTTSLLAVLGSAFSRSVKISQRINSRMAKLGLTNPAQVTLNENVEKLKVDFAQLNSQYYALNVSTSSKQDYLLFKSQLAAFIKNLKDVYKAESDLVAVIKKAASVTVTPAPTGISNTVSGQ